MKTVFDFLEELAEETMIDMFMVNIAKDDVNIAIHEIVTELNSCGMEFSKNERKVMEGWV